MKLRDLNTDMKLNLVDMYVLTEMKRLEGKIAIVTGSSSGIGETTARLFAREGAAVLCVDRTGDAVEAVAAEIRKAGGRAVAHAGNTARPDDAQAAVQCALEHFGALDLAFNNDTD